MHASSDEGTRFKLYPQPSFARALIEPETVFISSPAGSVGPGPSDDRAYTVYPVGKPSALRHRARPAPGVEHAPAAWHGAILEPAEPDAGGHFDYLEPGTPQFEMAHLFGTVRFVLDVWEGYFGRPIEWHFRRDQPRIELSILPIFDNAYSGYGFIEVGGHRRAGAFVPFSLNFDVIAHEVGPPDHLQRSGHP